MEHLSVSSDGTLHDTRMPDWSRHPLRADYKRSHGTFVHFGKVGNAIPIDDLPFSVTVLLGIV